MISASSVMTTSATIQETAIGEESVVRNVV